MKEFHGTKMYRGIQYETLLCANSVKSAAKALGLSEYYVKTWYSSVPAKIELLKKYPNEVFARMRGGALAYAFPKERKSIMTEQQIKTKIDKIRDNSDLLKGWE